MKIQSRLFSYDKCEVTKCRVENKKAMAITGIEEKNNE